MSNRNMKNSRKAGRLYAGLHQGTLLTGYEMAGWCLIVCVHVVSDISESIKEEEVWSHTFGSRIPTWS